MYSHTILFQPTRTSDAEQIRRSLQMLERLRDGWRPGHDILSSARHAERWTISRDADAIIYQFIGYRAWPGDHSALIIGTVLAIAPRDGWVLLASNAWLTLGPAIAETLSFDPIEVTRSAEVWLRAQPA